MRQPGFNILIPFVQKIHAVDRRELCFRIVPEIATTDDNVRIQIGGNLFVTFSNAEKAVYGASRPIYAVKQFAQSVMRTQVGQYKLDRLFSERNALNEGVRESVNEGTAPWGCSVNRFEITDLEPCDRAVSESLHKQSTAERERRETIITAEANKKRIELDADAYAYQEKITAQGDAEKIKLAAEAEAYRIERVSEAQKRSFELLGEGITSDESGNVVPFLLSKDYIEKFGKIVGDSNTLILPQNMTDLSSMVGTGYKVLEQVQKSTP